MNNGFNPNQNGYGGFNDNFYANAFGAPPQLEGDIRRSFSRIGLSLFLYITVSYIIAFAAQFIILLVAGDPNKALVIFENPFVSAAVGILPMYAVGLPILYFVLRGMETRGRKPLKMGAKEFSMFFLIGIALMYLGSFISEWLTSAYSLVFGYDLQNSTSATIESWPIWLVFILVVVLGPLVEEFIFRKLLIDRLSVYGDKIAIIISAVVFGIHHGNFFQFFYAAFLGVVLGYMYVKTNRLRYSFLMHAILNFIGSIVPMSLMEFFNEFSELEQEIAAGGTVDMERYYLCFSVSAVYSVIMFGMMIAGAVILGLKFKKFRLDPYCRIDIPRGRAFSLVTFNVGFILFILASCAIFGMSLIPA